MKLVYTTKHVFQSESTYKITLTTIKMTKVTLSLGHMICGHCFVDRSAPWCLQGGTLPANTLPPHQCEDGGG